MADDTIKEEEKTPKPKAAKPKKKKAAPKKRKKKKAGSGKNLVIVESPAKAKTINRILGRKYIVKASMGHVRDLPKRRFGIEIEQNFEPSYRPIRDKSKIIKELREETKKAAAVYLAPDPDREGEAIAWHLVEALRIPKDKIRRVTFNEITKRGVESAFEAPGTITMDRVFAQQARRVLDRIVGYKLSPLLWKKIGKGLSAGRVQSVAVRLVVERENEIRAFKPEEYWSLTAHFKNEPPFSAQLVKIDDQEEIRQILENDEDEPTTTEETPAAKKETKYLLHNQQETDTLLGEIENGPFTVEKVEKKERREKSPPPFTTSLLQQRASTLLRYSAKRTMVIAQQLYEGVDIGDRGQTGLITYMRTDSFRIAEDALQAVRTQIGTDYGNDYLPEKPIYRTSRKGAQEAHEAIRPTHPELKPDDIKTALTDDQYKLYKLIWERFVASQMNPARYELTDARIRSGRATFAAKGRIMKFDGFTRVLGYRSNKDDQNLPPIEAGQELELDHLDPKQHFTEPPPRYSEASLVRALEKHGIGRPSTYAPTISTIQDRGYTRQEARRLFPTELGEIVTGKLVKHFDSIVNTGFTAEMEKDLDRIEEGEAEWTGVLRRFYDTFTADLEKAEEKMESLKDKVAEGEDCPLCGKPMFVRWNRDGKFLGCSGFPDCRHTKSFQSQEAAGEDCEKCGAPMTVKRGRFGRFLACTKYPDCKNTRSLSKGRRKVTIPEGWSESCEKCGKELKVRYGRRGPFLACSGYPDCKNTLPIPKEWNEKKKEEEKDAAAEGPSEKKSE